MPMLPPNGGFPPYPLPPHVGYPAHPLPPLAHAGFDVVDSDPASSVASPSGASSCSYGSSLLPPRFEDFLSSGPTASEIFIDKMEGLVDDSQLLHVLDAQRHMLTRFEKTNEMLLNFNALSATRFENASTDFKRHTALLLDMKRELDSVFRRIRSLKSRLGKVYPEAFRVCSDVYNMDELLEEEEEEEIDLRSLQSTVPTPTTTDSIVQPDLRRRRSRSFPNSSFSSTLSSAESSSCRPLEVAAAADVVVVDAEAIGHIRVDHFEEVNVRSHQPVPEGESPPPPAQLDGSDGRTSDSRQRTHAQSKEGSTTDRRMNQRTRGKDEIAPSSRNASSSTGRPGAGGGGGGGGKLVPSRQVLSHEEKPCSSVNFATASDENDSIANEENSRQGTKKSTRLKKSESVGTVSTPTSSAEVRKDNEKLNAVTEVDDSGASREEDGGEETSRTKPQQRYNHHQQQQTTQRPKSQPQQKPAQPHPTTNTKPRPKSHPKADSATLTSSQDSGDGYDVSLSKMASEMRSISEGVAAAAAAAVDAVLTHTAGSAAASTSGGGVTPNSGRKVKPGYGLYQPPKKRTGSNEDK